MISLGGNVLSPAPLVSISRTGQEEKGGKSFAATTTITLRGTLISWKGSPFSNGTWHTTSSDPPDETIAVESRHTAILAKQRALRSLFSQQNQILILQPWDGGTPTKFVVRLKDLSFQEGVWWDVAPWTATFDADEQGLSNPSVESLSETWQIEPLSEDLGTLRVTHAVNAKGRSERTAAGDISKPAWEAARDYILASVGLGLDTERMVASGVLNGTNLTAYNYLRNVQQDEIEGTYGVNENWVAYDATEAAATHSQTVTKRATLAGEVTVSVEGEIQGLRATDNSTYQTLSLKSANANARWALVEPTLYASATGWYGAALNSAPLSYSVQENVTAGSISYNREFSNRVSDLSIGSVSERVEIRDTAAGDLYAVLPVVGRVLGPVMQDMGSQTARRRTLSIEIQMPAKTASYTPTAPDTDAYVLSRSPSANFVFLDQDEYSFDEYAGRYARSTTWSYSN